MTDATIRWLTGDLSINRIMQVLTPLGDRPVIVTDFLKSPPNVGVFRSIFGVTACRSSTYPLWLS